MLRVSTSSFKGDAPRAHPEVLIGRVVTRSRERAAIACTDIDGKPAHFCVVPYQLEIRTLIQV